ALTAIHRAGIVHRDLKPSNVVLSPFGPRVIDFGIARALDSATGLTGDLQQLGTPAFMSPEQIQGGTVTPAVDVWAWGGLVTYAATGRYPFGEGNAQVLLYRALHEEPRLDGVDPALHPIVWHAMRKDPAGRPTAQQLMLRLLGNPAEDPDATIDPSEVTHVLAGWDLQVPTGGIPSGGTPSGGTAAPGRQPTAGSQAAIGGQTSAGRQARAGGTVPEDLTAATVAATSGPGASGRPAAGSGDPETQARTRVDGGASPSRRRAPIILGAAAAAVAVAIAAALITRSGDDGDKADTADAAAAGTAFSLPRSAAPLGTDTMVFASKQKGNYDLYTGRVGTEGLLLDVRPITTATEDDVLPAISKDRRTVVFFRPGSPNALYAVPADGSAEPTKLFTSGPAANLTISDDSRPSLDPNGRFLVIRSSTDERSTPNQGLYVAALDGSSVFRLDAAAQATDPAWSPSGERIAYWSSDTESDRGFIVSIPVQPGSKPTRLTAGQGDRDADPTFSPDGKRIAFSRETDGDLEIWQMNNNGTGLERVTAEAGRDQDPAFSPDGRYLTYTGERGTTVRRIYLTDPEDTTKADRLLTETDAFHVRWSSG
ncbi:protein kinase domain-containing protein, partial [Frankia sp. EI5c]|uniref:protein kinase domain-containing protein n=1 Tax=Frankia sp. EI5c TaxID=683316 RepID=UPI001F5B3EE2